MTLGPYTLAWYGVDMLTGGIVEDLPALKPTGALSRKLGVATTVQFELALDGAPREWESATAPGRTLLVAVDTATDTPLWAGAVMPRDGGSSSTVQLGAATLEAYLDARYPGTQILIGVDQASVIAALATPALTGGPPIVIDSVATGTSMDYLGQDGDDKTILSCLTEVMGLDGGPEWTIDVAWNAGHNGFNFPLRVRKQIGVQITPPEAVFDFPGCVSNYSLSESYEKEKGATRVIARGEGEGESRLTSLVTEATDLTSHGWPVWEYRYTPASGVTDPDQLNGNATKSLALMAEGAQVWTMEAIASKAPRLGTDWGLGDMVHLAVGTSPRHPAGADVVARCWSWELEPSSDKIRPIIVEES
ncbi:hypothetical protein [Streptomyces sp. NBC_00847]|uniref:hypothetical protein n=1 Tax=Streptomyces sp. NBC_00847 TaxID=2975850 RepID=UPI00225E313C|nr:hypothetical protein [Streptomyces sp. NBC_00847]MCX4886089.1 hypothetical protein [Streptomyces sp. NBC_00847]